MDVTHGGAAMDMAKALADLGVSDELLDRETVERLDRDGYAPLSGVMSAADVEAFRDRLAERLAVEGERAGTEVKKEPGADRVSNLVDKGEVFDVCYTHPLVLAAVRHVLADFKLSSLSSRAALPGQGHQPLHADWWGEPVGPDGYQVCNTVWLLDDFTVDNGATRMVPGSHRWVRPPAGVLADPTAPHPDEVPLLGAAGTVIVFNGHIWHGGTTNRTDRPRRAMHAFYTRRRNAQQLDQAAFLRPETVGRLSPAARFVLDV